MTDYHETIDIPPIKTPTWAKIFAPIIALSVLVIQYCAFVHIITV